MFWVFLKEHGTAKKAISVLVAIFFFLNLVSTDVLAAIDQVPAPNIEMVPSANSFAELDVDTFTIPAHLGEIKFSYKGSSDKMIVHLQDAHCNGSAQMKISEIIDYLNREYGLDVINLEGGVGKYDLTVFTSMSGKAIRSEVAEYFVEKGEVNGAELYAINNPDNVTLWGIEDKDLYLANLKVYRDSLKYKPEVTQYLDQLTRILNNLKKNIFSEKLLGIDMAYNSYKAGNMEFREYLEFLIGEAGGSGVDIKGYLNISLLAHAMALESKVDFKKANTERDILVDSLKKGLSREEERELVVQSVDFKTKKISSKAFYTFLLRKAKDLGIDAGAYPALSSYVAYVSTYEAVDRAKVMEEIGALETDICKPLYQNDTQRELNKLSRNLALTKNIFDIALTKTDYAYYLKNVASFDVAGYLSFIAREAPKYKINARPDANIARLDDYRTRIVAFYEYSFKRDDVFIENMKFSGAGGGKKGAVMMTGGFHTENLCDLFRKEEISYVSILPKFSVGKDYKSPYFDILAGETTNVQTMLRSVIARASMLQVASKLSPILADAVYGETGRYIFDAEVRLQELVRREGCVELYADAKDEEPATFGIKKSGKDPLKITAEQLLAEVGYDKLVVAAGTKTETGASKEDTNADKTPKGTTFNSLFAKRGGGIRQFIAAAGLSTFAHEAGHVIAVLIDDYKNGRINGRDLFVKSLKAPIQLIAGRTVEIGSVKFDIKGLFLGGKVEVNKSSLIAAYGGIAGNVLATLLMAFGTAVVFVLYAIDSLSMAGQVSTSAQAFVMSVNFVAIAYEFAMASTYRKDSDIEKAKYLLDKEAQKGRRDTRLESGIHAAMDNSLIRSVRKDINRHVDNVSEMMDRINDPDNLESIVLNGPEDVEKAVLEVWGKTPEFLDERGVRMPGSADEMLWTKSDQGADMLVLGIPKTIDFPGDRNKRYALTEVISRGGFGYACKAVVEERSSEGKEDWQAVRIDDGRAGEKPLEVVVKILSSTSPLAQALFVQEFLVLAMVNDMGNAPEVYDMGSYVHSESDGKNKRNLKKYFIVEEFVEGETLGSLIEKSALTDQEKLSVTGQIIDSLRGLHDTYSVIHGDIKPDNIMIQRIDGRITVKILDFGIASIPFKKESSRLLASRTPTSRGTPEFMSTRDVAASRKSVYSDIDPFFMTIYKLWYGRLPGISGDVVGEAETGQAVTEVMVKAKVEDSLDGSPSGGSPELFDFIKSGILEGRTIYGTPEEELAGNKFNSFRDIADAWETVKKSINPYSGLTGNFALDQLMARTSSFGDLGPEAQQEVARRILYNLDFAENPDEWEDYLVQNSEWFVSKDLLIDLNANNVTKLGEGSMGMVYAAKGQNWKNAPVEMAVKTLNFQYSGDAGKAAILREYLVMVDMQGIDGIPAVYGLSRNADTDTYYLAMEKVNGTSLKSLLEDPTHKGKIDFQKAIFIAKQLALTMSGYHARGMVHGDIKPENIMVSLDEEGNISKVTLIDHGTAKHDGVEIVDSVMGSPQYVNLKALISGKVSANMDTYAIGLILLEMLTGGRPDMFSINGDALIQYAEDIKERIKTELDGDVRALVEVLIGQIGSIKTAADIMHLVDTVSMGGEATSILGDASFSPNLLIPDYQRRMIEAAIVAYREDGKVYEADKEAAIDMILSGKEVPITRIHLSMFLSKVRTKEGLEAFNKWIQEMRAAAMDVLAERADFGAETFARRMRTDELLDKSSSPDRRSLIDPAGMMEMFQTAYGRPADLSGASADRLLMRQAMKDALKMTDVKKAGLDEEIKKVYSIYEQGKIDKQNYYTLVLAIDRAFLDGDVDAYAVIMGIEGKIRELSALREKYEGARRDLAGEIEENGRILILAKLDAKSAEHERYSKMSWAEMMAEKSSLEEQLKNTADIEKQVKIRGRLLLFPDPVSLREVNSGIAGAEEKAAEILKQNGYGSVEEIKSQLVLFRSKKLEAVDAYLTGRAIGLTAGEAETLARAYQNLNINEELKKSLTELLSKRGPYVKEDMSADIGRHLPKDFVKIWSKGSLDREIAEALVDPMNPLKPREILALVREHRRTGESFADLKAISKEASEQLKKQKELYTKAMQATRPTVALPAEKAMVDGTKTQVMSSDDASDIIAAKKRPGTSAPGGTATRLKEWADESSGEISGDVLTKAVGRAGELISRMAELKEAAAIIPDTDIGKMTVMIKVTNELGDSADGASYIDGDTLVILVNGNLANGKESVANDYRNDAEALAHLIRHEFIEATGMMGQVPEDVLKGRTLHGAISDLETAENGGDPLTPLGRISLKHMTDAQLEAIKPVHRADRFGAFYMAAQNELLARGCAGIASNRRPGKHIDVVFLPMSENDMLFNGTTFNKLKSSDTRVLRKEFDANVLVIFYNSDAPEDEINQALSKELENLLRKKEFNEEEESRATVLSSQEKYEAVKKVFENEEFAALKDKLSGIVKGNFVALGDEKISLIGLILMGVGLNEWHRAQSEGNEDRANLIGDRLKTLMMRLVTNPEAVSKAEVNALIRAILAGNFIMDIRKVNYDEIRDYVEAESAVLQSL